MKTNFRLLLGFIMLFSLLNSTQSQSQNLALNKTTASSSAARSDAFAVDGDVGTRWESAATDTEWWSVDLGASYTIGQVIIKWEGAFATVYEIQISDNNTDWTTIFTVNNGDGGTDDITLSRTGRYVRYNGLARGTIYGHSFWEFEVYEAIAPVNDASLSDLQVDGSTVAGFSSLISNYSVELPGGTTVVPTVTATPTQSGANASIAAAGSIPGTTTVTVTAEDGTTTKTYQVDFKFENIATNKPATASSEFGVNDAGNAFDENTVTRWESVHQVDPQWIYVNLEATYNITGVELNWEGAYAKVYTIQVSDDAINWTTVFSESAGNGGIDNITFTATNGRYVRMYGSERFLTDYGYSLLEFEVYGTLVTYVYNNDTWSPSNPVGVSTAVNNIEIINSTAQISGTLIGNNLTISSGASLELDPASVLNLDGNITNEGSIVFKSDTNGSAQLDQFLGSISGSGTVTVERFIPARRAFRFINSTVNTTTSIYTNWQEGGSSVSGYGTHITGSATGAHGFDQTTTGSPSLFLLNNAGQNWFAVSDTDTNTLSTGTPYRLFVRGDRTIDLNDNNTTPNNTIIRSTGALTTGPVNSGNNYVYLATGNSQYSFLSNPYQARVDFSSLSFTGDVKTNSLYVWDATASTRGRYKTRENGVDNMIIQPGQSFFVQNSETVSPATPPSLTFTEAAKNTTGMISSVFSFEDVAFANLSLLTDSGLLTDEIKFRFQAGANSGIDDFDAGKLGNIDENMSVVNGNQYLSIERRALPEDADVLPLYVANYRNNLYTLQLNVSNWIYPIDIYVVDHYLNQTSLIDDQTPYSFSVDGSIPGSVASDRFSLVIDNTTLSNADFGFGQGFNLFPNPTQTGNFSIKTPHLDADVNIGIYNILGQQVYSKTHEVNTKVIAVKAEHLLRGVYLVKLSQGKNSFITKLIIE